MSNNNTLTIALTYENKGDPLVRDIMENFISAQDNCAKVYAVENGDLFARIEAIEEILDDWGSSEYGTTASDKLYMIGEVLR